MGKRCMWYLSHKHIMNIFNMISAFAKLSFVYSSFLITIVERIDF